MQTRKNAIIPFLAGEDFTGKEGHPVRFDTADDSIKSAGSARPLGVLTQSGPAGEHLSVAAIGAAGTFRVRLGAPTAIGSPLVVDTVSGEDRFVPLDTTTPGDQHERWQCAVALEPGAQDELIEAVLQTPSQISNPA